MWRTAFRKFYLVHSSRHCPICIFDNHYLHLLLGKLFNKQNNCFLGDFNIVLLNFYTSDRLGRFERLKTWNVKKTWKTSIKECYTPVVCNITLKVTPPWVFFRFFKLYKWYQIAQEGITCKCFSWWSSL